LLGYKKLSILQTLISPQKRKWRRFNSKKRNTYFSQKYLPGYMLGLALLNKKIPIFCRFPTGT